MMLSDYQETHAHSDETLRKNESENKICAMEFLFHMVTNEIQFD